MSSNTAFWKNPPNSFFSEFRSKLAKHGFPDIPPSRTRVTDIPMIIQLYSIPIHKFHENNMKTWFITIKSMEKWWWKMLMKVSIQYPFSLHDSSCSTLGEITINSPPCPGKLWFGGELPPGPFQTWCHGGHDLPFTPKMWGFLGGISRSPEIYGNLGLKTGPRKRFRCLFFTVGPKLGQLLDWVKIDPSMKSSKYNEVKLRGPCRDQMAYALMPQKSFRIQGTPHVGLPFP